MQLTGGLPKYGLIGSYLQLFVRYSASYPARRVLLSFLLLTSSSVFQSSSVRADGFQMPVLRQASTVGCNALFTLNDIHHATQEVSIAARPDLMDNYSGM